MSFIYYLTSLLMYQFIVTLVLPFLTSQYGKQFSIVCIFLGEDLLWANLCGGWNCENGT